MSMSEVPLYRPNTAIHLFTLTAVERGKDDLNEFKNFCTANGSSQDQNLAVSVLCVPNSHPSIAPRHPTRAFSF